MQDLNILISGLYSGPSPSAGLGVSMAVRSAFPKAHITGMDYWSGSSGIHHPVFDDVKILPSWDLIEDEVHGKSLRDYLSQDNAYYLPTLDLEAEWLARFLPDHPRVLSPNLQALDSTRKPFARIAEALPFSVPEFIHMSEGSQKVYDFCRRHAWRVWIKGPYHEALYVSSWRALEAAEANLRAKWGTSDLFVQAHKRGLEESVAFCAHQGRLLTAVHMQKRMTTPDGKTWSGKVSTVPGEVMTQLQWALERVGYTGGGEIEFIRTVDGVRWFNELNPRFPAWINGAAKVGMNLPAALVAAAAGIPTQAGSITGTGEFTRVVTEIPTQTVAALPLPPEPLHGQISMSGKYGANMSSLVKKVEDGKSSAGMSAPSESLDDPTIVFDINQALDQDPTLLSTLHSNSSDLRTPQRILLPQTAKENFLAVSSLMRQYGEAGFIAAYSLKTCGDKEFLKLARESGMRAEAISLFEVKQAIEHGWNPEEIILNGPAKWWPFGMDAFDGLYAVFADSIEELQRLTGSKRQDQVWGARVKLPGFKSRFGIDLESPDAFMTLAKTLGRIPSPIKVGLHMHLASNLIGNPHWLDAVESVVAFAQALEEASGRVISVLDLGGGYYPRDVDGLPWSKIITKLHQSLPHLQRIIIEPGRAMSQNAMAVVSSVLDVRRTEGEVTEVVLDTCISDLPLVGVYPHRFFLKQSGGPLQRLDKGEVKVLGRICMEDDILSSGLNLPTDIAIGDLVVIGDAGAYERSMSYEFGRGGY